MGDRGRRRRTALILLPFALAGAADPGERAPPPLPPTTLPPLPPAVLDDTLEIGGQGIDARKVETRMTVAVQLNGRGPYRFVVDSGADTSVIGTRAAAALKMPAGTPVLLNGVTARSYVDRVRVDQLKLGESSFNDLHLPVLKDSDLGGEGMIGIDALVEQRLMLDFEKRTIAVEDARRPQRYFPGEVVVYARQRRGQLILTEVMTNSLSTEAVIDTGSQITIGNMALRDKLFRRHPEKLETVEVTGVTGVTVQLQISRINEIKLGSVVLQNVPIAFAEVPPFAVFGLSDKPAMLLGTDLMETFRRVSLDFRKRKVRFQLKRCGSTGVVIATTIHMSSRLSSISPDGAACRR